MLQNNDAICQDAANRPSLVKAKVKQYLQSNVTNTILTNFNQRRIKWQLDNLCYLYFYQHRKVYKIICILDYQNKTTGRMILNWKLASLTYQWVHPNTHKHSTSLNFCTFERVNGPGGMEGK